MMKEAVLRRPKLAVGILFTGAASLWFLCQPAIWTRGYPKIAPVWQAMPWLWVVPVILSAVYDNDRRRRRRTLILFAIAVGFILAGTWGASLVPRRMSYTSMLMGLPFWGPAVLITTLLLEAGWQRLLGRVRCFTDDDRCGKCGYSLHYLTVARCPECGTSFDARWLEPDSRAVDPTPCPWRSRAIVMLAVISAVAWPFLYHVIAMMLATRGGWAAGKYDWARGQPAVCVGFGRFHEHLKWQEQGDPLSGLPIRFGGAGLERRAWLNAYNAAVNEELAKTGKQSLSMFVLSSDAAEQVIEGAVFSQAPSLPLSITNRIRLRETDEGLMVNGTTTYLDPRQTPCEFCLLSERGLVVLRWGDELLTLLEDGTPLQYFIVSGPSGRLRVLP